MINVSFKITLWNREVRRVAFDVLNDPDESNIAFNARAWAVVVTAWGGVAKAIAMNEVGE